MKLKKPTEEFIDEILKLYSVEEGDELKENLLVTANTTDLGNDLDLIPNPL